MLTSDDYTAIAKEPYPCKQCEQSQTCTQWESMFCCNLCRYLYNDDTPCDTCDPHSL